MTKRKTRRKAFIISIAAMVVCLAVSVALVVTNIFIPLKYLSSYLVNAEERADGTLSISFIDVGYGDCTVVRFPDGKNMLIDGGDGTYSNNSRVLKELNFRGIDKIDYLICSSVASYRCGGLAEIIRYKEVGHVYAPYCPATYINEQYRDFTVEIKKRGITPKISEYGAGVFEDGAGYNFCILSPSSHKLPDGEYGDLSVEPSKENTNAASAVIWIEFNGKGFLLLGDIPAEKQKKLFSLYPDGFDINGRKIDVGRCVLLKVPNHGDRSSAYTQLYDYISPTFAVLSIGKNGFGNPSVQAVSDAQQCVGENFYRTDADGTVTARADKSGVVIEKEKK